MKLSIIIPAYNSGGLIRTATDSVTSQPFDDWEMLIVDDGSTDNTPEICDALAESDSRIRVIHTENRGAYLARLAGVGEASGEWIMFMDSDDSITPQCITGLFAHENDVADIIVGTINLNNKATYRHRIEGIVDKETYIEALLTSGTSIGPYSKLFRRSLFRDIFIPSERITNNEDLLLLISLAGNAGKILIDNSIVCYNYIFRDAGIRMQIMPVAKWQLLFDSIRKLTACYDTDSMTLSWTCLVIDRAYHQMILRGLYLDSEVPFVREILACDSSSLPASDRRMLRIIRSAALQHIAHWKYAVRNRLRTIVRKFI